MNMKSCLPWVRLIYPVERLFINLATDFFLYALQFLLDFVLNTNRVVHWLRITGGSVPTLDFHAVRKYV